MVSLPIISASELISANTEIRANAIAQLGAACREVGFFYLVDHGISEQVFLETFAASQQFFALPAQDKQRLSIKLSRHNRGYTGMADERLNPAAGADQKEAFNMGVDYPADHPFVLEKNLFAALIFGQSFLHLSQKCSAILIVV